MSVGPKGEFLPRGNSESASAIRAALRETTRRLRRGQLANTKDETRQQLVIPFIQALGYNASEFGQVVFDYPPHLGYPDYKADIALLLDNSEVLLVVCRPCSETLGRGDVPTLLWLLDQSDANVAILTNGVEYKCYSNLGTPTNDPFLVFRLDFTSTRTYEDLVSLCKDQIAKDATKEFIARKRQSRELQRVLIQQYDQPTPDFIQLLADHANLTEPVDSDTVQDAFFSLVNNALNQALVESVTKPSVPHLRKAM